MTSTLVHIISSPYQGLAAKEGLELAMVLATFEQQVELAFSGAGIALLYQNQSPQTEHGKALYKLLPSLEFYDIDKLYLPAEALKDKRLDINPLASAINDDEWQKLLTRHTYTFRF